MDRRLEEHKNSPDDVVPWQAQRRDRRFREWKARGALTEYAGDVILSTDVQGHVTFMGPQARKYGFEPDDNLLIGRVFGCVS